MAKTILVAEDRDASRELLCTVLTAAGYVVVEACDGREAVERALETQADLVILDLYMPHTDGFGVLARFRLVDDSRRRAPAGCAHLGTNGAQFGHDLVVHGTDLCAFSFR